MPVGFICNPPSGGCGATRKEKWRGRCTGCGGLYHCKQTIIDNDDDGATGEVVHAHGVREARSIEAVSVARLSTGFEGLDRILGCDEESGECGLAATAGHTVQFTGAPGAGKSTLLTQICYNMTRDKLRGLYVSGEEGPSKFKARADRIGIKFNSRMLITDDTDLDRLFYAIVEHKPDFCIVDSLQKIRVAEYAIGSQQAASTAADDLYKLADKQGMGLFLVNQTNKAEDDFAGAKAIEHAVDTSLFLRLRRDGVTRELVCKTKNRYGETPGYQRLEMTVDAGLIEIESEPENEQTDGAISETTQRRGARLRRNGGGT